MTCGDLSCEDYTKNFKTFAKKVSIPRMDEKKLHTQEFQLKGIGANMSCRPLEKVLLEKQQECSKHLRHIAIEKDIFSELNRCIFQISLKYIKLVTPRMLKSLAGCRTMFLFTVFCKIAALERNAY